MELEMKRAKNSQHNVGVENKFTLLDGWASCLIMSYYEVIIIKIQWLWHTGKQ